MREKRKSTIQHTHYSAITKYMLNHSPLSFQVAHLIRVLLRKPSCLVVPSESFPNMASWALVVWACSIWVVTLPPVKVGHRPQPQGQEYSCCISNKYSHVGSSSPSQRINFSDAWSADIHCNVEQKLGHLVSF